MALRIDHAVRFVADLPTAVGEMERVGFRVTPGGAHPGGHTFNALVVFPDGSYLELLAFTIPDVFRVMSERRAQGTLDAFLEERTALDRRFLPLAADGAGWRDAAIGVADVKKHLVGRSMPTVEGPFVGARTRPDGVDVAWELAVPVTGVLPFLIRDVTARHLRVPDVPMDHHPNGVVGIGQLEYQVREPGAIASALGSLLNVPVRHDHGTAAVGLESGKITYRAVQPSGVGAWEGLARVDLQSTDPQRAAGMIGQSPDMGIGVLDGGIPSPPADPA